MDSPFGLLKKLSESHSLSADEYRCLLESFSPELSAKAAELARQAREPYYSHNVFIRGLIEISSICRNDCLYCGLRASNKNARRYRLPPAQILECAGHGYKLGFRTFVLQGGEDPYYSDQVLVPLLKELKQRFPDTAVTLSLGERSGESYRRLYEAGADRYLLRHETADPEHYKKLHPATMSLENRIICLHELREAGFAVGAGFMVGSPYQTLKELCMDLTFIQEFSPEMCGIGPFIPHRDTPFRQQKSGSVDLTCFLLSIIRLIKPNILLPATTALATLSPEGHIIGLKAGANVIMPNLSPVSVRKNYQLYDNKACFGMESAEKLEAIKSLLSRQGYTIVSGRGDMVLNS